jgi:hypothetical protein
LEDRRDRGRGARDVRAEASLLQRIRSFFGLTPDA